MTSVNSSCSLNMDVARFDILVNSTVYSANNNYLILYLPPGSGGYYSINAGDNSTTRVEFYGQQLKYDLTFSGVRSFNTIASGSFRSVIFEMSSQDPQFSYGSLNMEFDDLNSSLFKAYAQAGDNNAIVQLLFSGNDHFSSSYYNYFDGLETKAYESRDLFRGYGGNDDMWANGLDTIYGGTGDDTISATPNSTIHAGDNYLRGDEGNDLISGGPGFDDINGNMGADSCSGFEGDDWVVGGKDNDVLCGDDDPRFAYKGPRPPGDDIVYGNLGNDTCSGDEGDDTVRGGQGDDTIAGGDGADWMSGDRGNDTASGGSGADIFHTFSDAGLDRVTDFNRAEGDRVMVDPGTIYSARQEGADIIVDMGGGNQMVLLGVQMSTLSGDWIFGA